MDDEGIRVWCFDFHAEGAHRGDGAEAVFAGQEAFDHARAVAHRGEHHRAVRDAFIARDGDLGAEGGSASDFPVGHYFEGRRRSRRALA